MYVSICVSLYVCVSVSCVLGLIVALYEMISGPVIVYFCLRYGLWWEDL